MQYLQTRQRKLRTRRLGARQRVRQGGSLQGYISEKKKRRSFKIDPINIFFHKKGR